MNTLRQCRPLLGTYVEIHLTADEDDDALLDRSMTAFEEIQRLQRLMSFHDPVSELTRINQTAHLGEVEISHDLWRVLAFAGDLFEASGGYFDPTIAPELIRRGLLPDHGNTVKGYADWSSVSLTENSIRFSAPLQIDLGGIAKGYAVDRALHVLGSGVDATVNAGGDLAMAHWPGRDVEIRTPASGGRETVRVPMENCALATSATYYLAGEQVILDPYYMRPFPGKQSVSIFAKSCMIADALTKAALLMPDPARALREYGASGIIISLEGHLKRV